MMSLGEANRTVSTPEGDLILDDSKLRWHMDRVRAWEAGERIAPISVDLALQRACQAACRACYAVVQEPQERLTIGKDAIDYLLEDFAGIGVRGVSIVSDGESTLNPHYAHFIETATSYGIDVGNATNGWLFTPELAARVLPHLKWVRFTVLAGRPESYTRMMHPDPSRTDVYWNAMRNISEAVRIKRQRKLSVTLGIQTFVTPEDGAEIKAFAQLGIDLGVQYAMIKHTSDDEVGTFGVIYGDYPKIYQALHEAEAMSTAQTKVIVKWSKIRDADHPSYKRMYAAPFLLQLSGSGLIAPSGMFFNQRFSKFHLGNFVEDRFIDVWRSERYWRAMNYLASPRFDAATMMGFLPIQHYANVALDRHVKGIEKLTDPPPGTPIPLHVNFA